MKAAQQIKNQGKQMLRMKNEMKNDRSFWGGTLASLAGRSVPKTAEERNKYEFSGSELETYRSLDKRQRREFLKNR